MARDYLAIPATSVPSEQVFSVAGNILTRQRSRLSPHMINTLMSCNNWMGLDELNGPELVMQQDVLQRLNDLHVDGDVRDLGIAGL